jgi:hypothetical protein
MATLTGTRAITTARTPSSAEREEDSGTKEVVMYDRRRILAMHFDRSSCAGCAMIVDERAKHTCQAARGPEILRVEVGNGMGLYLNSISLH